MDNGGSCEEVDAKLVHETLQLLSHVTYIRVLIDRVIWMIPPKIIKDEKHCRSPRSCGQIYLTYQIPALNKASPRGSIRTFKVVAKDMSCDSILFNDKRVCLCRITPHIIDCWATSDCEIKLYYIPPAKKSGYCFAKCSIPMSKVLVLPFSFDSAKIPLNMLADFSASRGYLSACIQLGSRMQHFFERIEPMRNPTTSVSPLVFADPSKFETPRSGSELLRNRLSLENDFHVEKHVDNIVHYDKDHHLESRRQSLNQHRPSIVNVAGSASGSSTPASESNRRRSHFLNAETHPPEPLNTATDQYGGVTTAPEVEAPSLWRENRPLSQAKKLESRGSADMTEAVKSHKDTRSLSMDVNQQMKRRSTVADRFKERHRSLVDSASDFPDVSERGYWLQLTVGRARHLYLVDYGAEPAARQHTNCFVTYRNNDRIFSSDIVCNSSKPVWNWTTQMFVPSDRRNIVFKIWHRSKDPKSRDTVIGFVAVDLSGRQLQHSVTNWYDVADLSRTSSGQLQVTLGPPTACDTTMQEVDSSPSTPWYQPANLDSVEPIKQSLLVQADRQSPETQSRDALLIDLDEPMRPDGAESEHRPQLEATADDFFGAKTTASSSIVDVVDGLRRESLFDPFVDLTSRSVIRSKLRANVEKLTDSLNKLQRRSSSHQHILSPPR